MAPVRIRLNRMALARMGLKQMVRATKDGNQAQMVAMVSVVVSIDDDVASCEADLLSDEPPSVANGIATACLAFCLPLAGSAARGIPARIRTE